jgi:hypothetical protein
MRNAQNKAAARALERFDQYLFDNKSPELELNIVDCWVPGAVASKSKDMPQSLSSPKRQRARELLENL